MDGSRGCALVWFRRDLRVRDHVALERAAASGRPVACAFVLDEPALRAGAFGAPIVQFFFASLAELRASLRERGGELLVVAGDARRELPALAQRLEAAAVYFNEDYEPAAIERDAAVAAALRADGVEVRTYTDHVALGADEVVQASGKPYTVFTPYKRRWLETFTARPRLPAASERGLAARLVPRGALPATRAVPAPEDYGLASSARYPQAGETRALALLDAFAHDRMAAYRDDRDLPALDGTSRLSPHLRAGTIGIRSCVEAALRASGPGAETWLSELIWREFYQQILRHFPHVASAPFLTAAAGIAWRDAGDEFAAWCDGRTGVPIVDAAMRQLNETAWMHNRLRMIVASYLTKHLLIDWRRGERTFALRLADADLAANNGGWQWSASTGTDAAPYFRVFNPVLQGRRFDPDGAFVKAMLPELAAVPARYVHEPWLMPPLEAEQAGFRLGRDYPAPLVDLAAARERALAAYAPVLGGGKAGRVKS